MKKIYFLFLFSLSLNISFGQFSCQDFKQKFATVANPIISIQNNAKSDTIDILNYDLDIDFTEVKNRKLYGSCAITFYPKMNNISKMNLDLLQLQVDSILMNNQVLNYSYNDTILSVDFPTPLAQNDTNVLMVFYGGTPPDDGSGFGGWDRSGGYHYNMGVAFLGNPHTYGRAWFPCFDNFVEKTTYDFSYKTVLPLRPYSNGIKLSEDSISGDTILTKWKMTDEIPTYLASVAISNYIEINDTTTAQNGTMPIQLIVKKSDSSDIVNSFQNLKPTFHSFEKNFGPYFWQRVGYAATPVGAMEHATSIHYPTNLINGNLNGEDIMAHELAHHWWGNLVTCETDADMWINEGMAEFCSHLYEEDLYGRDRYLNTVMDNAFRVLDVAHLRDDGFKAIQGITHEYVYGFHVYQKGAMVAHNLRAYLGDSLFFNGLTQLLANNKYGNLNSTEFRDQLSQITGKPLNDFFTDWVFNAGFPVFSVDSLAVAPTPALNSATVKISQRVRKAPRLYQNIPVFVTFFSENGDTISRKINLSGSSGTATFNNLLFAPKFAMVSYDGKLLSGDTYDEWKITQTGVQIPKYSFVRLTVNSIQDSAKIIAQHHWGAPNGKIPAGRDYRLSNSRFWTIQGVDFDKADLSARFDFNGNQNGMDSLLAGQTSDSIAILYRKDATENWQLFSYQNKTQIGAPTSGFGWIDVDSLRAGDYTFANTGETVGLENFKHKKGSIEIFPNPAKDEIEIRFENAEKKSYGITVLDIKGKLILSKEFVLKNEADSIQISLPKNIKGKFVMVLVDGFATKVVLK